MILRMSAYKTARFNYFSISINTVLSPSRYPTLLIIYKDNTSYKEVYHPIIQKEAALPICDKIT